MFKKFTAFSLILALFLCAGCKKKDAEENQEPTQQQVSEEGVNQPEVAINPLTGEKLAEESIAQLRPVALMINNDVRAQNAQAGLPEADIIYETEIEGGETRLMAVFQNVEAVQNIGTIRSARNVYVELALAHDAVYIHRGGEMTYVGNHLKMIDSIDIHENLLGERLNNGLALEHTLYTHGAPLWQGIGARFKTSLEDPKPWQNFADEEETVTLTGGAANKVRVPFSGNFKTIFVYDAETGLYERNFNSKIPTEYFTKESTKVKNIVVCLTSITDHPNGVHRTVDLQGGEGYYITNGTYQAIQWSKGEASAPLKFTNADGSELKMSAGNTWVCLASQRYSQPVFE